VALAAVAAADVPGTEVSGTDAPASPEADDVTHAGDATRQST
jgi:hypothetical protein